MSVLSYFFTNIDILNKRLCIKTYESLTNKRGYWDITYDCNDYGRLHFSIVDVNDDQIRKIITIHWIKDVERSDKDLIKTILQCLYNIFGKHSYFRANFETDINKIDIISTGAQSRPSFDDIPFSTSFVRDYITQNGYTIGSQEFLDIVNDDTLSKYISGNFRIRNSYNNSSISFDFDINDLNVLNIVSCGDLSRSSTHDMTISEIFILHILSLYSRYSSAISIQINNNDVFGVVEHNDIRSFLTDIEFYTDETNTNIFWGRSPFDIMLRYINKRWEEIIITR